MERVVLKNSAQKQIFVDLEGVPAADDRIIIQFHPVRFAGEIHIVQAQNKVQFFLRLKHDRTSGAISKSLERFFGIIVNGTCMSEKQAEKQVFCELSISLDAISGCFETLSRKNFISQNRIKSKLRTPGQPKTQSDEIKSFHHLIARIIQVKTPIEGLDPLKELGLWVEPVHGKGGKAPQAGPCDKTGINLKILGNILIAEIKNE